MKLEKNIYNGNLVIEGCTHIENVIIQLVKHMIGKMLKYMRVTNGYNQMDLAKKLNLAQTTLSGYETHYSNPDFETIERIANTCNFDILFYNRKTKEYFKIKDIERKDI